jgi:hypothetical protein
MGTASPPKSGVGRFVCAVGACLVSMGRPPALVGPRTTGFRAVEPPPSTSSGAAAGPFYLGLGGRRPPRIGPAARTGVRFSCQLTTA